MVDESTSLHDQRRLRPIADIVGHRPITMISRLLRSHCSSSMQAWLVGGALRDLLVGVQPREYDIAVLGNAIDVGRRLVSSGGRIIAEHPKFGTCDIELDVGEGELVRVDIAEARSEIYQTPGALPEVTPAADISVDLVRRDFTINALALPIAPQVEDRLIDMCGGASDLAARVVRVLHDDSFIDDPTRMFRAARYASRYGQLDTHTRSLIAQSIERGAVGSISASRMLRELQLMLAERSLAHVEAALAMLESWGLLGQCLPRGYRSRVKLPGAADDAPVSGESSIWIARLASLMVDVDRDAVRLWCADAGMSSGQMRMLGRLAQLQHRLEAGAPRRELLDEQRDVLEVAVTSWGSEITHDWLRLHDAAHAYIVGRDLHDLGVQDGPELGSMLDEVRGQILDGRVTSRQDALHVLAGIVRRSE